MCRELQTICETENVCDGEGGCVYEYEDSGVRKQDLADLFVRCENSEKSIFCDTGRRNTVNSVTDYFRGDELNFQRRSCYC